QQPDTQPDGPPKPEGSMPDPTGSDPGNPHSAGAMAGFVDGDGPVNPYTRGGMPSDDPPRPVGPQVRVAHVSLPAVGSGASGSAFAGLSHLVTLSYRGVT